MQIMNRHPNLPQGMGDAYVIENVFRALSDLCDRKPSWRERICNACSNVHRPNDNEFFTGYMSDETLQDWRDCSLSRFDKPVAEFSDDEVAQLAESLRSYIYHVSRDRGICEAGQDPKAFNRFGTYPLEDPSIGVPVRNRAEQ